MLIDVRDTGTKATLNIFEHELYTHTQVKKKERKAMQIAEVCSACVFGTGQIKHPLTFAVNHTVVLVVVCSLPSHIQQPPGACVQHQWDVRLCLLQRWR